MTECFVYFIEGGGKIKIGSAVDPWHRLATLRLGVQWYVAGVGECFREEHFEVLSGPLEPPK